MLSKLSLSLVLAALSSSAATPVILISVDTLRADHLGRQTPHIDSLAKNGTLFSQATTPYPLTLPAHVALLTSTYPFSNGVLDNGIPLGPNATTLATLFQKAGYRTGAFVGSFVLDRRFGLSRGFEAYNGPLDVHDNPTGAPIEHKRPGEQVEAAAKHWVEDNANAPFFLFLHLYDLHAPYSLPADPSLRHGETGYQAELAHVDQILGDFFAFLDHRGLLQKSLIVFTSDHGEGLGDHGETSHGYFIYQSTLHVPLIIHWPVGSKRISQDRVDQPVSLLDVAPTILEAAGLARPTEMRGRSLFSGAANEDVYSESVYARKHFGCSSLRSLRAGSFKYIDAPKPELYDLAADPAEKSNIYDQQKPKAAELRKKMRAVRASSPVSTAKPTAPSAETSAALRSLGYLSGSSGSSRLEPRIDPKDRIADFERYSRALALATAGKTAESDAVLEKLRDAMPDLVDIRMSLGLNLRRLGQDEPAVREYKRAVELDPGNATAHFELAQTYFKMRQGNDAIREFQATLAIEPWYTRADEALAQLFIQGKDFSQAREHLQHMLTVDPDSYTAHFNLGIFAAMEKNWPEAQRQVSAAVHADPNSAEAHNALGGIYFQQGDLEHAQEQFQEAIRLQSRFAEAHYRLGLIFQKQGKASEAEREFRTAQQLSR